MSECSICGDKEAIEESQSTAVCSDCLTTRSSSSSKAKSFQSEVKSMSERKPVAMKAPRAKNCVTVFSRQYRNKQCRFAANLDLIFDDTGHALMEEVHLEALREFMKYKPGRLRIVAEEKKAAPVKEVEIEVFVGEEPQDGVEIEIIVGEDPADVAAEEKLVTEDKPKNKKDKKKSSNKKKN